LSNKIEKILQSKSLIMLPRSKIHGIFTPGAVELGTPPLIADVTKNTNNFYTTLFAVVVL
jgi:hypothetical protein